MGNGTVDTGHGRKTNWKDFREHPAMVTLTTIVAIGAALTVLGNATGWYDSAHTSGAELQQHIVQYNELKAEVTGYSEKSTCESLAIRIALAESAIWQMEQAGVNSQRLVEKKRELRDLLTKYNSLLCASKL